VRVEKSSIERVDDEPEEAGAEETEPEAAAEAEGEEEGGGGVTIVVNNPVLSVSFVGIPPSSEICVGEFEGEFDDGWEEFWRIG